MSTLHFVTPAALWALLALPVIWWLLRATPPRPIEQAFPPLRILQQLKRDEETPDKTPWWLLLLRLTLAAFLIFAVAHPFTRSSEILSQGNGPVLLVVDDGWAAAPDWVQRQEALGGILNEAEGRVVYFASTALPQKPEGKAAAEVTKLLRATQPQALATDRAKLLLLLQDLKPAPAEIIWLSDGLDAASSAAFSKGLSALALTQIYDLPKHQGPLALGQPTLANGEIVTPVMRSANAPNAATLQAIAGDGRVLAESKIEFAGAAEKQAHLSLPAELRNSLQSLALKEQ
ncbi:MAG: BatA domain-containing protein, partial [Pseudomonadota bacterium]|nr:BatA domain-containing protein [Pseudomonadota bacterium]